MCITDALESAVNASENWSMLHEPVLLVTGRRGTLSFLEHERGLRFCGAGQDVPGLKEERLILDEFERDVVANSAMVLVREGHPDEPDVYLERRRLVTVRMIGGTQ